MGIPSTEYAGSCDDENTRLRSVSPFSSNGCSNGSSLTSPFYPTWKIPQRPVGSYPMATGRPLGGPVKLRMAIVAAGLVAATTSLGDGARRAPPTRKPPTTPGNLRVTGTTPTSISLAWNAST